MRHWRQRCVIRGTLPPSPRSAPSSGESTAAAVKTFVQRRAGADLVCLFSFLGNIMPPNYRCSIIYLHMYISPKTAFYIFYCLYFYCIFAAFIFFKALMFEILSLLTTKQGTEQ